MKISVAMCTYNGQRFLLEQLNSFLNQSYLPDELVVCDDGSTDETVEILRAFAQDAPFPVRIFCNKTNLGSTRNFVKAMSLCTGDLIALSDQDDIWKKEKLSTLSQVLERDSLVSAVFSNGELIDAQCCPLDRTLWGAAEYTPAMQSLVNRGHLLPVLRSRYFVTGATLMFRAEMRDLWGDIPSDWIHDAWMSWKFAIHGKLVSVPLPLIEYRIHTGNQVGVNTSSVAQTLKQRNVADLKHLFLKEISQLGKLSDEIAGDPEQTCASREALGVVEARMRYLQKRIDVVGRSKATRPLFALFLWRQYGLYGKGWRSLLADMAL